MPAASDGPVRPSRRERLRAEALTDIKAAALEQVREVGASALSLRGVATSVGMSSPGLYRYFDSRDALLTALITDAFSDLGATLEAAREAADGGVAGRWRAVCAAYFDWARDHRAEFSLVFGSPVPGYAAPPDGPTADAARRFAGVFVEVLGEAWQGDPPGLPAPRLRETAVFAGTPQLDAMTAPQDARFLATCTRLWGRLHGVVALGLFGHLLPGTLDEDDVRALFDGEVEDSLAVLGLS